MSKHETLNAATERALECVREWTQIDGRLVLRDRDLADFRNELAAVIRDEEPA